MGGVTLTHYLALSALLFAIGTAGVFLRRNVITILLSIEIMMLMATATDLLTIFLALEILSISVYVMTGLRRDSPQAIEAAFKYFFLGAFASAFFLYGTALTYTLTGSTRLERVGTWMAAEGMILSTYLYVYLTVIRGWLG